MGPQPSHVLVVDDEPAVSKVLGTALMRAGFRVTLALSGDTAMSVVREQPVDVLVVDFRIGDMRGDELYELASATQPHLRRRTMVTTGDISERVEETIKALGVPMLRKPFDLKELIDWVRSVQPRANDQSA